MHDTTRRMEAARMSNVVKIAVPAVRNGAKFVVQHWQSFAGGFALVSAFIKEHPEIPGWLKGRIEDVQRRVEQQLQKRDPVAQIKGVLAIVREEARAAGDAVDARPWTDRADSIERDLRLAALQSGAGKRSTLVRLKAETADLVSGLLLATARSRATTDGSDSAAPPD